MNTIRFTRMFRLALLSLSLVAALALAGCNVSGVPSSGSNTSTSNPTTASSNDPGNPIDTSGDPGNASTTDTSGAGTTKIARTLSTNPPVTFRYASIDFTIKKALITNELPHFQGHYSDTDATIYLTLSATNDNVYDTRISSGLLDLKLGSVDYKKPVDTGVQSRDTQSIDFEWDNVPLTTTWESAQLNINQEGKEPVTVSLDKPQPAQYPITLTPGADVSAGSPPITYSVTLAQIGLDGVDSSQLQQADQGSRFVTIKFSTTNQSSTGNAYMASDYVTLRADGKPVKPNYLDPAAEAIQPLKTTKFTAWFVIPADTKSLVLEVGNGDQTAQIPLAMPLTP